MAGRERKNHQVCQVCNNVFNDAEALWTCTSCDHHWDYGRDECHNCYDSRRKSGQRMLTVASWPINP